MHKAQALTLPISCRHGQMQRCFIYSRTGSAHCVSKSPVQSDRRGSNVNFNTCGIQRDRLKSLLSIEKPRLPAVFITPEASQAAHSLTCLTRLTTIIEEYTLNLAKTIQSVFNAYFIIMMDFRVYK